MTWNTCKKCNKNLVNEKTNLIRLRLFVKEVVETNRKRILEVKNGLFFEFLPTATLCIIKESITTEILTNEWKIVLISAIPQVMLMTTQRERERERERQIRQLRTRITELEAIINRTPAQEQELQDKKKELAELEKQQQEGGFKKYLPWIIGGGVILIIVVFAVYLLTRNKGKKKYAMN